MSHTFEAGLPGRRKVQSALLLAATVVALGLALSLFAYHRGLWPWGSGIGASEPATARSYQAKVTGSRPFPEQVDDVSEQELARLARDPEAVARGETIFAGRCGACHAPDGRGLVGPNLTDDFQIRGSMRMDIFETVKTGVLSKGMIGWGSVLSAQELKDVVAFTAALRGKNLPGKAPEGQKVAPFAD